MEDDESAASRIVILWHAGSRTVGGVPAVASPPRKFKAPRPDKDGVSPPDPGTPLPGDPPSRSRGR